MPLIKYLDNEILRAFCQFYFSASCSNPPSIPNANLLTEASRLSSTRAYVCKEGFAKVGGDDILQCVDVDGKSVWRGKELDCQKHISTGKVT